MDRCYYPDFTDRKLEAWRVSDLTILSPGLVTVPGVCQGIGQAPAPPEVMAHRTHQRKLQLLLKTHRKAYPISAMERNSLKNISLKNTNLVN